MLDNLRQTLAQYANREIDIGAFEDWVVSHLQPIFDSGDQESIDIANTLDARFIELGESLITEDEFFNEVQAMQPPSRNVEETVVLQTHQGGVIVTHITHVSGSLTVESDAPNQPLRPVWVPAQA
jgi:hypothetical protein